MSGHGYRYVGDGDRFRGVPARDLTQEEFDRLGPLEQRTVRESGAYEAISAKEARESAAEAKAAQEAEEATHLKAEQRVDVQEGAE